MNTLYERFVSTIENRVSPLAGRSTSMRGSRVKLCSSAV